MLLIVKNPASHNKQCPCQETVSSDPSFWLQWRSAWVGRDRNVPQTTTVPRTGWPAESVPPQGKWGVWQRESNNSDQTLWRFSFHVIARENINQVQRSSLLLVSVSTYLRLKLMGILSKSLRQLCTGACFSKVPKLFGRISGDIILFISSKRRRLEARNFAVIFISIPFTTY